MPSAKQQLATHLRLLRETADDGRPVTYRKLAERTHFSIATLNRAATGSEFPTWPVVEAFVAACGGDPEDCRELWERAQAEPAAPPETPTPQLDPAPPADGAAAGPAAAHRRPWSRWVWPAGAVVVVLAAAAVVTVAASRAPTPAPASSAPTPVAAPSPTPSPPTTAEITSPAGSTVGFQFLVSGTLAGAPPRGAVWEVTLEMDDNRFYPLNRACVLIGGQQFNCGTAYAGQEDMAPGSQYTVLVVDADSGAVNAFQQYNELKRTPAGKSVHGMTALPPDARIIGQELVTRS